MAVSLANYGLMQYMTKVPEHEIGQCAVNALRGGVHTDPSSVEDRLGIYFCETGFPKT